MSRFSRFSVAWVVLAFSTSVQAGTASFMGLGDLSGGNYGSGASGISADGSVVVGYSPVASNGGAFRWTLAGGMVGLGTLPGDMYSVAYGASADGAVVVGHSRGGGDQ